MEKALSILLREKIRVVGTSRTDAGVHALGQVLHFDTAHAMPEGRLAYGLSSLLPQDISVVHVEAVSSDFHAQLNAVQKDYVYSLYISKTPYTFWDPYAWRVLPPLDTPAMQKAADCLIGRHDFRSFCAADATAKTFVRELKTLTIERAPHPPFSPPCGHAVLYAIRASGTGFLKFMIRNMVGTLVDVGRGRRSAESIPALLAACDRKKAGRTAPARGLCLEKITLQSLRSR